MVLGIGDVECVVVGLCYSLWMEETGRFKDTILPPSLTGADDILDIAREIGDDDAIMVGVHDEEAMVGLVCQHCAGEAQRRLDDRIQFQGEIKGGAVNQSARIEFFDDFADEAVQLIVSHDTSVPPQILASRVDELKSRPDVCAVQSRHSIIFVVDDRVFEFITLDDVADVFSLGFVGEFGCMDTDDDEFVGVFFLQ